MMTMRININRLVTTLAAALYYLALVIVNQFGGRVVSLIWLLAVGFAAFVGVWGRKLHFRWSEVGLIVMIILTGMLNIHFIGGTTYINQGLIICFFLVSIMLSSPYVNENIILALFFLNVIVVIYRFSTVGFRGMIYTSSSSNFVSVQLLYPLVVYYCIVERNNKRIRVFPALCAWVLSLLSRGRGGILATTILLVGIVLLAYNKAMEIKKIIAILVGIIAIGVCALNAEKIIEKVNNSIVSEYFRDRGMESVRTEIWKDYIKSLDSEKEVLLGGDITNTYAGMYYSGNVHNSFLNIHIHNGLIMVSVVLLLVVCAFYRGVKWRKWVYLVCMGAMFLRAFTDNVFWPAYGTPVLFFLLLWLPPRYRLCSKNTTVNERTLLDSIEEVSCEQK